MRDTENGPYKMLQIPLFGIFCTCIMIVYLPLCVGVGKCLKASTLASEDTNSKFKYSVIITLMCTF